MRHRTQHSLLALLTLALTPAGLFAQAPASPEISTEVQGWIAEMQEIQSELLPVQQKALQETPELQEQQQQISVAVQQAMTEVDPDMAQQIQRLQELQQEGRAAQEAGDGARIMELTAEAQGIQQKLATVQAEALQNPEVAPQVEEFQTRLQERMIEIDPQAKVRLERLDELERQLVAAMGQPATP